MAVAVASWSAPARGGGGAATDAYDGIRADAPVDAHGFLDLYGQARLVPSANDAQYRAFDDAAGGPAVGFARLTLAHAPQTFGFRLDAGVGELADGFRDIDPANASHPGLARATSFIEQGFVTAVLPLGRGLAIDVGKFGTPVGLEENESLTDAQYSRGLLFTLAEPTYHTGVRATLPLSASFAFTAFSVNGWNTNLVAGNGMRSVALAATWDPSPKSEIVLDYMVGPERAPTRLADPTLSLRHELDAYASYALDDRVSFAVTGDYGHDAAHEGVAWSGIGGYLRAQMLPWLAAAVRGEHLTDGQGFTSGTPQRLAELTLTLEVRAHVGSVTPIARLEYRRDQSDEPVFDPGGLTHQDTLTLALLAAVF